MKCEAPLCTLDDLDKLLLLGREALGEGPHRVKIWKHVGRRTLQQNSALHLYCEMMASRMTDAGITQRELVGRFKDGFELPVTEHMIKDIIRAVGLAMYKKQSTADLTTIEISQVHEVVDQRFGEVTGVTCPWPSRE